MKKVKLYVLMMVALCGLNACTNSAIDDTSEYWTHRPMDFQVGVTTRGSHTPNGNTLTDFGICVINKNPDALAYNYNNIHVTGSNETMWQPQKPLYWQDQSQAVDILAYAPAYANDSIHDGYIHGRVESKQTKESYASDFLLFKRTNFIPQNGLVNGKLCLQFKHMLSQLIFNIKFPGKAPAYSLATTLLLNHVDVRFKTPLTYTWEESNVTAIDDKQSIEAFLDSYNAETGVATFSCILPPQTFVKGESSIVIGGEYDAYSWEPATDLTFESGKRYTFNITLSYEQEQPNVPEITSWNDNNF